MKNFTELNSGNRFSKEAVKNIARNPIYKGTYLYNRKNTKKKTGPNIKYFEEVVVENMVPAIVSKELFDSVQAILDNKSTFQCREKDYTYLLTGLIKCKSCGRHLTGISSRCGSNKTLLRTYGCKNHKEGNCPTKNININYIEKYVVKSVVEIINNNSNKALFKTIRLNLLKEKSSYISRLTNKLTTMKNANTALIANSVNPELTDDVKSQILKEYLSNTKVINESQKMLDALVSEYEKLKDDSYMFEITSEDLLKNRKYAKAIIKQVIDEILVDETNNEIIINFK